MIKTPTQVLLAVGLCFFLLPKAWSQSNLQHQVITLANTTDIDRPEVYAQLRDHLRTTPTPTTVLVAGDMLGSNALSTQAEDSIKITQLLRLVEGLGHVKMVLLPGDRDWDDSGPKGWRKVRALEKLVESFKQPNVIWAISKGCPGPEQIQLNDQLILIAVQSQWWVHPYDKPEPADADCKITTRQDFIDELDDLIDDNEGKNILLAAHMPVLSYGHFGGKWPVSKYLLPIPILGSFHPSFHRNIGNVRDVNQADFKPFKDEVLEELFAEYDNLIYLSGHEHNLQVLKYNNNYLVNSGSPANPQYAGHGPRALYSKSQSGFLTLQYYSNGQVTALSHQINSNQVTEAHTIPLFSSICGPTTAQGIPNTRLVPCQQIAPNGSSSGIYQQPVIIKAGGEYKASRVKEKWMGKHYRDSWTTPVTVPYLNLDTTHMGLVPFQKGGGRQTISLKFKAGNGGEYVLRSVNKDPTKALSYQWRETVVGTVVKDQTSAQQPFGAITAAALLNPLGVLHAHPKLYVLPKDDRMGPFKETYGDLFGMLEERPTNPKKVDKPFADADEIRKSYRMFRQLYDDHDNKVQTEEYARARVFDLLVGDWGKHEDNWKWAGYEQNGGTLYRPIPRDRDHVFSLWDGILPWLADREWAKSSAANFGYEIKGIRSLMWQARHQDRLLANQLNQEDWLAAAKFVQTRIDDQLIESAVKQMPQEIYAGDGKVIEEKLKNRKKHLDQAAIEYYELLAKQVDVIGSNKREFFEVNRMPDGKVEVNMYDLDKSTLAPDLTRQYYHRQFLPSETKEIRLYGLHGADVFKINGTSNKSIKLRVIGGPGADQITDDSKVKAGGKQTLIYEKGSTAPIVLGNEGKRVHHWNDKVYDYNRTAFAYNTYFPIGLILFSSDLGLGLKLGVAFTRQKFGKEDYASKHSVSLAATSESINVLSYEGQFHHVLKKWDVTLDATVGDHYYFNYFFGLGNDTQKDQDLFDADFYRTRYNTYQFSAGLQHKFLEKSFFDFKIHYENNAGQIETNTILDDRGSPVFGAEDTNLWQGIASLDLDFRDGSNLPEHGIRAFLQHESGLLTTNDNADFGLTQAFIEQYLTVYSQRPITLGFKFGGSRSYGDVPYYKLKYLGQNNDLRGYFRNRFTGKSTIFFNSELRWELADIYTNIVPLKFGLKAFYDTGRVYSEFDVTNQWHKGYGAGFYLVPLETDFAINVSFAFSEEETGLVLVGIGKSF